MIRKPQEMILGSHKTWWQKGSTLRNRTWPGGGTGRNHCNKREEGSWGADSFLQELPAGTLELGGGGVRGRTLPVQLTEGLRSFPVEIPLTPPPPWPHPAGRKRLGREEKVGEMWWDVGVGLKGKSTEKKPKTKQKRSFMWFRVQV